MTTQTIEEIFEKHFKLSMKTGTVRMFRRTYPTLYDVIMKSIREVKRQTATQVIQDKLNANGPLTKEVILKTGNWEEADYVGDMEGYFWKHRSIENDGYNFYMRRQVSDGFTTIIEEGKSNEAAKFFEGYIENETDLNNIVRILKLHEI